jgi:choline transport protein
MLLSLINLGSAVALNIITSLGTGALLSSYIVSVSCIGLKRLRREPLLPRRWSLGKWGLSINVVSVLFMILCFIMNFFPQSPHELTAESFNWNIVIVSTVACQIAFDTQLTDYSLEVSLSLRAFTTP